MAVLVAAGTLGFAFGAVLWSRVQRFPVSLPGSPPGGTTYLLIGSDSRAGLESPFPERFGDTSQHPGERADVVILMRVEEDEVRVMSVPRDLLVLVDDDVHTRLTLTLLNGPQSVVDSLCDSLGIGIDHVAMIRFNGLRDIVDAVGGVDVNVRQPVRDDWTGLNIEQAGSVRLDGESALAYIRSRHMLGRLPSGEWVPAPEGEGRSQQARDVLTEIGQRMDVSPLSPVTAGRRLWVATSVVAVDNQAGPLELRALARGLGRLPTAEPIDLPVVFGATSIPTAQLTRDASAVLQRFDGGDGGACRVGLLDDDAAAN